MKFIFSYLLIVLIFLVPLIIYIRWYPRTLSCLKITSGGIVSVIPVKPNKAFFRSVSLNRPSSFISIGSGYFIYSFLSDSSDSICFNNLVLSNEVYIFSKSKFGRFKSLNLSDRCLIDSLSKFNF